MSLQVLASAQNPTFTGGRGETSLLVLSVGNICARARKHPSDPALRTRLDGNGVRMGLAAVPVLMC